MMMMKHDGHDEDEHDDDGDDEHDDDSDDIMLMILMMIKL